MAKPNMENMNQMMQNLFGEQSEEGEDDEVLSEEEEVNSEHDSAAYHSDVQSACVQFSFGDKENDFNKASELYRKSLELYKKVLQLYPNCPAAVRLGRGLCRYKLGQFDRARQAFKRQPCTQCSTKGLLRISHGEPVAHKIENSTQMKTTFSSVQLKSFYKLAT